MKILIVSIYNPSDEYSQMLELQQKYVHSHDNVDTYFITCMDQPEEIKVVGDMIYVKGDETPLNILMKTVKSIDYLLNTLHKQYDYIVRTNISTIIHLDNLYKYLESSPRTLFYSGGFLLYIRWSLVEWFHLSSENKHLSNSFYGTKFIQGTSIILSIDMIQTLLRKSIDYDIIDDIKIGLWIKEDFPDIYNNLENVPMAKFIINEFSPDCVFIRNKSDDRRLDVTRMKDVINKIHPF